MGFCLFRCTVCTCCINNILCTTCSPWNQCRIWFWKYRNLLSFNDQSILICIQFSLKTSKCRIIPDHILHITQVCIPYIDSAYFKSVWLINGDTECYASNTSKSVNADWNCHVTITSYKTYLSAGYPVPVSVVRGALFLALSDSFCTLLSM